MKVVRRLGKYEIDFKGDLILTKHDKTVMQGRDLHDFKMINIVRIPMKGFTQRINASIKTLFFIWLSGTKNTSSSK